MQTSDAQQLLLSIIEQAQEENAIKFKFITSWAEYKFYWRKLTATKIVIRLLKTACKNLFNSHCKDIINGAHDASKIIAYARMCEIKAFYETDLDTLYCMIRDYENYLGEGNFLNAFLGGERDI